MQISKFFLSLFLLPLLTSCQKPGVTQDIFISPVHTQAILGGTSAKPNEFPFIVNIWLNSPRDSFVDHLCGGSLIHPKWVLTAAHCMLDDASETLQKPLKTSLLSLYMGSEQRTGEGGRMLKVKSIIIHPQFSWPHHDVALIELAEPVNDVTPIVLNDQDPETSFPLPLNATVIGWGLTDQDGKVDGAYLQKITLPLVSRKECGADPFPSQRGWTISPDILCMATQQNQRASCPGDSGGPLFVSANGYYKQIGIVSWGSACSGNSPRRQSNIEGHASISDAYPWIQQIIR